MSSALDPQDAGALVNGKKSSCVAASALALRSCRSVLTGRSESCGIGEGMVVFRASLVDVRGGFHEWTGQLGTSMSGATSVRSVARSMWEKVIKQ
eukprot:CAMPEP_0172159792 /NCGR_PEP_ID=MMETSP1050-20130122/5179_1 /TAXON_ID=233186 /ORGANISM="Cryptomonas curvata, Strain CCAP979/52" /LENGTH=94 /DNA_ID=CAMNT_0012829443 /DNA_START=104 /DNA_END=388 /DNA_ORIENTATION=-